jgi:fructosamine-3-kinase
MSWKNAVIKSLELKFGKSIELCNTNPLGGGDINDAYRFETSAGSFFIKKNSASRFPEMFQKEAKGLQLLGSTNEISVPEVVLTGEDSDVSFLVLKYIQSATKSANFWEEFGKQLSNLHKHSNDFFGLNHDNYIGSLHQSNRKHKKWTDFFREERLKAQVKMARDNGRMDAGTVKIFDRFYSKLDEIFPAEPPALLHGDLWGGNFMVGEKGNPIIIDPAVYFGHREMDLSMSKLFGGFSAPFYKAYNSNFPLEKGWEHRMDYCNLYPLLVHVNLFGGGYLASVKSILQKFR